MAFGMWGFTAEALARIQERSAASTDPEHIAEAQAKREAEKKVEEEGRGECMFCDGEIVKNMRNVWESEFLLEYCADARDGKHKPKVHIPKRNSEKEE